MGACLEEASYPSKISNIFFGSLEIYPFLNFKKKFARKFLEVSIIHFYNVYYTFALVGKCVKKHIRIILLEIQLLLIKALYRYYSIYYINYYILL